MKFSFAMWQTTLVLFFLFPPNGSALKPLLGQSNFRAFVSTNRLWCGHAPAEIANDALSLFKSLPRGKLYEGESLSNKSCDQLGFNLNAGEDPCYPGLQTFFHNDEEKKEFVDELQGALVEYAGQTIDVEGAQLIESCKCKDGSYAKKFRGSSCGKATELEALIQSNPQRIFISANKLWCAQARLHVAHDALNLYRSMPRSKLYDGSFIRKDHDCLSLGYTQSAGEDPCYRGLQTFFRNENAQKQFLDDFAMALKEFGEIYNNTVDEVNLIDTCQCQYKSVARIIRGSACADIANPMGKMAGRNEHQKDVGAHHNPTFQTFVSADKLWCGQAVAPIAADALSLFKSMPRGKQYEGESVTDKSCEHLGYSMNKGEDPCYPGLQTFYRNDDEQKKFLSGLHLAFEEYGEHTIDLEDVKLIDSCTCKNGSSTKNAFGASCKRVGKLQALIGHNPLRNFVSADKLWCGQAPMDIAEDALSLYKSMPRGNLYEGESVKSKSCEQLGYTLSEGEDPCYPGLHTFYRSVEERNKFLEELQKTLHVYAEFTIGMEDAKLIDSCKCKNGSYAKKFRGNSCEQASQLQVMVERNPFRTFVSANKMSCAQARESTANAALHLFKSMPRAKLYDGTSLGNSASCKDLGYHWNTGGDPCFPGLRTFYRSEKEKDEFVNELNATLTVYGTMFKLTLDEASLIDSCKCKAGSYAKTHQGNFCVKATQLEGLSEHLPQRTFISKNKMWCAQAQAHVVNDALNLYKSMPRAKLYDGISISEDTNCSSLGYGYNAGEDPCYPGLQTFYRSIDEKRQFVTHFETALKEYGTIHSIALEDVNLMDSCQCKQKSYAKNIRGNSCDKVNRRQKSTEVGTVVKAHDVLPRTFISANKLWCGQAPANIAEDALSLYKSMPRGKMYEDESVSEKSCEQLGYTLDKGEDPCYPGLQTFYRNEEDQNKFKKELTATLREYGDLTIDLEDAELIDSCKCRDGSDTKNNFGNSCKQSRVLEGLVERNPLRTFVSANRMFCAQARKKTASAALNLFRTMPRAKLYYGISLSNVTSCKSLGYHFNTGEDSCFPGLRTFYRSETQMNQFLKDLEKTKKEYGEMLDVTLDDVSLIDSCKCKIGSYAKKYQGGACKKVTQLEKLIAQAPQRSFVSKNKMWCGEGKAHVASDALNLYKSMPRAKLYEGSLQPKGKSCKRLGYTQNSHEDPCYPGLKIYYRSEDQKGEFEIEYETVLKDFGKPYNFTMDNVELLDSCNCKPTSSTAKNIRGSCDQVSALKESIEIMALSKTSLAETKRINAFVSTNKLWCGQGDVRVAEDALGLYQSMPRGKQYEGEMVSDKSCKQLGYELNKGEDPCFPGMQTFYRSEQEKDKFIDELQKTLLEYGKDIISLEDVKLIDSCKCRDGSYAKNFRGSSCSQASSLLLKVNITN